METVRLQVKRACDHVFLQFDSWKTEVLVRHDNRPAVYALAAIIVLTWMLVSVSRRKSRQETAATPRSPDVEKRGVAAELTKSKYVMSEPGVWTPSGFRRPAAAPYPEWSIEHTKPLPYRPFRPKYFVTLGLRNMEWDEWIELDSDYPKFHALKRARIAERGARACRTAPEAYEAACELLAELVEYLPQRYPSLYRRSALGLDNLWSGESFDVTARPLAEDPMQMAARLVQDDLALMIEGRDGQYYLLAGAILLAGFWRLEDKFGMPLSEVHTSGDVPQFRERLEKGMMNFFRRLRPEAPMLRNNYFIQVDDNLPWSWSIGSEDSEHFNWDTAEKGRAVEHHHFRSERQSLRRLPKTGAVAFTIRTYFHPITDICREPYVPGRLARAVRSWSGDVARYRGRARYGDVLLEYLDARHAEQVAGGLREDDEDDVVSYPYRTDLMKVA